MMPWLWLKIWRIHSSSWFWFDHLVFILWFLLIGVALLASYFLAFISSSLESLEWEFEWDNYPYLKILFWRFYQRILKTLILKMFLPFDDRGLLRFLIMINYSFIVDEVLKKLCSFYMNILSYIYTMILYSRRWYLTTHPILSLYAPMLLNTLKEVFK